MLQKEAERSQQEEIRRLAQLKKEREREKILAQRAHEQERQAEERRLAQIEREKEKALMLAQKEAREHSAKRNATLSAVGATAPKRNDACQKKRPCVCSAKRCTA